MQNGLLKKVCFTSLNPSCHLILQRNWMIICTLRGIISSSFMLQTYRYESFVKGKGENFCKTASLQSSSNMRERETKSIHILFQSVRKPSGPTALPNFIYFNASKISCRDKDTANRMAWEPEYSSERLFYPKHL